MAREEAIDWLARVKSNTVNHTLDMPLWWNEPLAEALEFGIKALEQEPRKGHWIRKDNGKYHWYLCSWCDATADSDEKMIAYKYCPNCGAKMESEDKNDKRRSNKQT